MNQEMDHGTARGEKLQGALKGVRNGIAAQLRLLLVDDVPENLDLLEDILAEEGYATVRALNGIEALQMLEQEEIHLIVADAMMPKMDGFTLCKEVRAQKRWVKVPFLIYTGNYVDAADQEFARGIGVDRYVVKYAGLGALVQAVNDLAARTYGREARAVREGEKGVALDDQEFLEQHHAIVIRKLEEKMAELEVYAETLRKKSREIEESEARYRGLFDHAGIAIFLVDRPTGRVLDVNPQGLTLLHSSRDRILALPSLPFADSAFQSQMLGSPQYVSADARIRVPGGALIDVEVGYGPMTAPDNNRVLVYMRDITEGKRLREQLLQAEKMTLMGRLAAGIAHEIRNPLSALTLNLQYLVQKLDPQASLHEYAAEALEGARRVDTVVESTLALARVTPPLLQRHDLNALVMESIGFLRFSLRQKGVTLETDLAPDLPAVKADGKQLQQAVLNVVQNAIDATPENGCVTVSTARGPAPDERVVLAVQDSGAGISPDLRDRLFEDFFTTKAGGTGIGLALSKQIVLKHHGQIQVDTATGGGTIIRIVLPVHAA